jgi:Serine/threonine protein kinase
LDENLILKINKKQLIAYASTDYLKREIKIQKKLDHPHIIKLVNYFENQDNVYLVLEYAENGNLFYYLRKKKRLSEKEAFVYFFQTCISIDYLHKKGILHRDLKVMVIFQ